MVVVERLLAVSCYEWSWLSYLVQCCYQTIVVGYYWFRSAWRWYCIDVFRHGGMQWRVVMLMSWWYWGCPLPCPLSSWCRVMLLHWGWLSCYHAATSQWQWYGRMIVAMSSYLMPHDVGWCYRRWRWYCIGVLPWWWYAVVRRGGGWGWCLCGALHSWWCVMMMLILRLVVCCWSTERILA